MTNLTKADQDALLDLLREARPYIEAYCQEHGETGTLLQSKLNSLLAKIDATTRGNDGSAQQVKQ